jgi:hypothetical protein
LPPRAGSGHAPRRIARTRSANAVAASATAATPRNGCAGANVLVAPEAPSKVTTSLLHTGQPMANQPTIPEPIPARGSGARGTRDRVRSDECARQDAEGDQDENVERAHADLTSEPRVRDYVGRDPDEECRAKRAEHGYCKRSGSCHNR